MTTLARAQLAAARDYIRDRNPTAAREFQSRVAHRLRLLGRFPGLGHRLSEAPDGPLRLLRRALSLVLPGDPGRGPDRQHLARRPARHAAGRRPGTALARP